MADHALLSASGAKKWLTCTPSARIEEQIKDEDSEFAKEGTVAHEVMELLVRQHYFNEPADVSGYPAEMVEAAETFLAECRKISDPLDAAGEPYVVLVEHRVDYSPWVPEGFGTGDFILVTKSTAYVRDLKYGKGVAVETEDNSQMKLYGLGAYRELSFAFEGIDTLDVGIVQPRIGNIASCRVSLADLLAWAEDIRPLAEAAWAGEGTFVPGEHCTSGFCKARFTCRYRAMWIRSLATERKDVATMTEDEVAALLPSLDEIVKWANGLKGYALSQAVDHGVIYDGLKLVEGRSYRYITNSHEAALRLLAAGYEPNQIQKPMELFGITELEEVCGKKKFAELLGDIVVKPEGKPTLVPVSDKRKEWKPKATAEDDFAD